MHSQDDILSRLWTAAHAMFDRLRARLGEAAALAARARLAAEDARAARTWLGPLEAMVRKVVLVHALALIERRDTRRDAHACAAAHRLAPREEVRAHPPVQPAPPALTLITLPAPPVLILSHANAAAAAAPARPRAPTLRLWPRKPASAGPRVRDPAPALLVRDIQRDARRLALSRQMRALRARRRSAAQRLARRIEALAAILAHPLTAARRLARKLTARPSLAMIIASRRAPRTRVYVEPEYALAHASAMNRAYDWSMDLTRDTS